MTLNANPRLCARVMSGMFAIVLFAGVAAAEEAMQPLFEDFAAAPETRWHYVADGVMGGVSQGQSEIVRHGEYAAIRLWGRVSTDNNGGFIQVRRDIAGGLPSEAQGLRLSVRGNGETYYVFLRTHGLTRVWHSYRFSFTAPDHWSEIEMNFADFVPSHGDMPPSFDTRDLRRIGLVAYGQDYDADLTVRSIAVYD